MAGFNINDFKVFIYLSSIYSMLKAKGQQYRQRGRQNRNRSLR